jgi:hypothetical protein
MNNEPIEAAHALNKKIIEEFNIKIGTKMLVKNYDGDKEETITWINPHYYWIGSEKGWIFPHSIISVEGRPAKDKIEEMRKEAYGEEKKLIGGGNKDQLLKEKNPF